MKQTNLKEQTQTNTLSTSSTPNKLHIAHPENVYKSNTDKMMNKIIKEREANQAYYSSSENVQAARDFIFGRVIKNPEPANEVNHNKKTSYKNQTPNQKKVTDREEKGLCSRKSNTIYTLQPNDKKVCVCCNVEQLKKDFSKQKGTTDDLMTKCKSCDKKRQQANGVVNKKLREEDIKKNVKRECKICKCSKDITEFYATKTGFRGSKQRCKSCV